MFTSVTRITWARGLLAMLAFTLLNQAGANERQSGDAHSRSVDVVIALDVSTSMDGLIESAKQRLWDVVNELGRAQPRPELRMAILSYGNPEYGTQSGFVRIDLPFTSDLDAVSKVLFEFSTNGGDEYVGRVVNTALNELEWSESQDAMRVLFIAGNEGAHQDPQFSALAAAHAAADKGIVVNTIYCGGESDGDAAGWRDVAAATNGLFASINQDAAAVASIATPMDQELVSLDQELNETYVAYGKEGAESRANQAAQDANVSAMGAPAMASRAAAKASPLYNSESWDLVDAVGAGKSLEDIEETDLPEDMQDMEVAERIDYLAEKQEARKLLQARIQALAAERQDYVKGERARLADSDEKGLDDAIQEALRELAGAKGFTFDEAE